MPRSLTFAQFQQALLRGDAEPIYLFDGEEGFLHEEGIRLLAQAILPEGSSAVDREATRGGETTLEQILDRASTFPMGGGRRLIVVREADALRCDSVESLKAYLARPSPKSCVVFSETAFDKRRTLYRTLLSGATRVECAPLDDARTTVWVRERLRSRGFGIGIDLAEAIATGASGGGLGRLDGEIQKLMSAIGEPRPVEPADLAILADVPRVEDAFRLAALIARGERGAAVQALRLLLRAGEDPIRLLGGLSWYFRNALKSAVAASRRMPVREMTTLYGVDPGRIERFHREIGRIAPSVLREALAQCHRADRELKGAGTKAPAQALERLVHTVGRRLERTA